MVESTVPHAWEHPVNHIGYLHEIVRRENYFIRFCVTEG